MLVKDRIIYMVMMLFPELVEIIEDYLWPSAPPLLVSTLHSPDHLHTLSRDSS
jgi:hypothetical protein